MASLTSIRDAMVRHCQSHHANDEITEGKSGHERISRACTGCVKRKLRCDEAQPCHQCLSRGLHCERAPSKTRKVKKRTALLDSGHALTDRIAPEQRSGDPVNSSHDPQDGTAQLSELQAQPLLSTLPSPMSTDACISQDSTCSNICISQGDPDPNRTLPTTPLHGGGRTPHYERDCYQIQGLDLGWNTDFTEWLPMEINDQFIGLNGQPFQAAFAQDTSRILEWGGGTLANVEPGPTPLTLFQNPAVLPQDCPRDFFHHTIQSQDDGNNDDVSADQVQNIKPASTARNSFYIIAFPDIDDLETGIWMETPQGMNDVPQGIYDMILDHAIRACKSKPLLNVAAFPSRRVMGLCIQLYFQHFHATFPIIHEATFSPAQEHCVLVMAVATIGCRFAQLRYSVKLSHAMSETLRLMLSQLVSCFRQRRP
jgi:hypothetical protein